jgi:beta-mannosidase
MDQPWSATLRLRLLSVEGIEIDSISQRFDVLARGNRRFELPADWQNAWRRSDRLIVAETDASDDPADRAWWFGSFDREIPFAAPAVSVQCQPDRKDPHRYRVTATADTLIRELCLFPDRLAPDARVDRQLVNLLPGEQVTFTVNCSKQLDTAAFCRPEVLRTVSGLVSQRSEELNVVEPTAI